jgi:D-tyrosyl-tRNA(Tyr) deacylase
MIALLQRVSQASVSVDDHIVGAIERGLLVFVGIESADEQKQADRLLERILNYRIFEDEDGKMNRSVKDINGGLLLVSQFTLAADTQHGNRPGFSTAMEPQAARLMFAYLCDQARQQHHTVQTGQFGAHMQVALTNDGPVTFQLRC